MREKVFVFVPILGNIELVISENGIVSLKFIKRNIAVQKSFNSLNTPLIKRIETELKLYVNGKLKRFSVPVDLTSVSKFTRCVLEEVKKVPYGETTTYKHIASAIGNPHAYRVVGNSVGKNPVPIIIPCHRVIRSDGSLGGFSAGISMKKKLLEIEKRYHKN